MKVYPLKRLIVRNTVSIRKKFPILSWRHLSPFSFIPNSSFFTHCAKYCQLYQGVFHWFQSKLWTHDAFSLFLNSKIYSCNIKLYSYLSAICWATSSFAIANSNRSLKSEKHVLFIRFLLQVFARKPTKVEGNGTLIMTRNNRTNYLVKYRSTILRT